MLNRVAVLVALAALLGSCSTPASPCSGCSDITGACQPGTLAQACGNSGSQCVACAAGQACNAGLCVSSGVDGGGACVPEIDDAHCSNGIDDDCDGFADCRDFSCELNPNVTVCPCTPTGPENTAAACGNGIDDDCDNFLDCRDFDCARNNPNVPACCPNRASENTNENCSDGVDNDCNGFMDCGDFACSRNSAVSVCDAGTCSPTGAENTAAACSNGLDDDCDGYRDCRDYSCAGTTPCPVGSLPACSTCDAGASCQSGRCTFYSAFPAVTFCSASCSADGGGQPCPATMVCNGQGTCVPKRSFRCTTDKRGYEQVDMCGHTFSTTPCPSGQACTQDGGSPRCAFPAGIGTACSLCRRGPDCATGWCLVANGETVGYCSRPCSVYADCIEPNGSEPFDSCLRAGTQNFCTNIGVGVDRSCTANDDAVVLINSCGAVVQRETCTGDRVCGRGSPSTSYPSGPIACHDPCYRLNGTSCYGGSCTSCYYTYSSASNQCCGVCDGVRSCTSL